MAHEIANVEEIAGMLAVQRSNQIAGIEVLEGNDSGFGITEGLICKTADGFTVPRKTGEISILTCTPSAATINLRMVPSASLLAIRTPGILN